PRDARLDAVQGDLDLPLSLRLRMRPEALLDPGEPEHPERIKAIGQRTLRPEPRDDGDTLPMGDDDALGDAVQPLGLGGRPVFVQQYLEPVEGALPRGARPTHRRAFHPELT